MPPGEPSTSNVGSKRKRTSKEDSEPLQDTDDFWECSVCTLRNRFEAFKCSACETRKGTSTRKPKLNDSVVERHKTVQNFVVQQQEKVANGFKKRAQQSGSPTTSRQSPESSSSSSAARSHNTKAGTPKQRKMVEIPDMFIYRNSTTKVTVTADGVVATITEFRRKPLTAERVGPRRNIAASLGDAKQ